MGEVFLAWDENLARWVALKRIRPDSDQRQDQIERFLREARSAASLSHSAIVQIHDLIPDPPGGAIVMEYVEGKTLCDRVAAGPLPVREALRLAREIAEGLAAAHSAGFIHRDLKTENVIITPQGQPKILDFGLVKPIHTVAEDPSLTRKGIILGTFRSMSPEQACCEPLDERSDLFSLGVLLYEMLSGRAPFRGKKASDTLKRVIADHPPALSGVHDSIPQGVSDLVDRLLAKSRDDRPPNARVVIRRLQDLEAGLPASSSDSVSEMMTAEWSAVARKGEGPTHPLTSTGGMSVNRRRRHFLAAGAVALVAVLLGTAMYLKQHQPTTSPPPPVKRLRVAVAPIQTSPAEAKALSLAVSGVQTALLGGLHSLKNVDIVDPSEAGHGGRSPVDIAKATAADEVVMATVTRGEDTIGQVELRRVHPNNATDLWRQVIEIPTDPENLQTLTDLVADAVRQGYTDRARSKPPKLDARKEDIAAFLRIKRRIDSGQEVSLTHYLTELDQIIVTSPKYLDAYLLDARIALSLYRSKKERSYLDHATAKIQKARTLANDPRLLASEFQIDLAGNLTEAAEDALRAMEREMPGDPSVLTLRSSLLEKQGKWPEALDVLGNATHQIPSWQNKLLLAKMQARHGQLAKARETLAELPPDNTWGKEGRAELELENGDPAKAEQLFKEITDTPKPLRNALINLGFSRALQGNYKGAAEAYRRALDGDPDYPTALFDLADAEKELHHDEKSASLYQRALDRITAIENNKVDSTAMDEMMKAQCQARLHHPLEAVRVAEGALVRSPDDPLILIQAAMVYSLVGDQVSAVLQAEKAVHGGVQTKWLKDPAFRSLARNRDFQNLLHLRQ